MNDRVKVCQDRLLPQDLVRPHSIRRIDGRVKAIIVFRKMWVNGSTLRVRFLEGTAAQRSLVEQQANWWTAHANLRFDFNNAPDAEIRIAFDPSDGAWSYIGTDARQASANEPTMNLGFLDGGTAAHEFGHAIGLGHEHQNPAGGIVWNEAVVLHDLAGPPNNWTADQIRHNVLRKYEADQIRGTTFDRGSIMLYFFPASWVQSGVGTPRNEVLSALDTAFIASEQAYPPTVTPAVPLTINAEPVAAAIGQAGEEDLFDVAVTTAGRHVFETGGQSDVVMKLFGPDNPTSLVAEDDDGGAGLNSRIVADLIPGAYLVQIRHYNKTSGTGSYTVQVTR